MAHAEIFKMAEESKQCNDTPSRGRNIYAHDWVRLNWNDIPITDEEMEMGGEMGLAAHLTSQGASEEQLGRIRDHRRISCT